MSSVDQKTSSASLAVISEKASEVSEQKAETSASFERELELARRQTNFLFYKSVLPFKIDNIPPEQLEKLISYFQTQILNTLVKRKESKWVQVNLKQTQHVSIEPSSSVVKKMTTPSPTKIKGHGLSSYARMSEISETPADIKFGLRNPTQSSDDRIDEVNSAESFRTDADQRSQLRNPKTK